MMPSSYSGTWTDLERSQFEEGVIEFGWGKWLEISACIPSRRKDQIKSHAQKFSIHRKKEYAELLRQHTAKMEKKSNCVAEKQKKKAATAAAASTPTTRNVRRPSRSSIKRAAATKSAAPTPVKVRRASKSSISTIESVTTITPKPVLAKAKKPSKKTVKTSKLGAQLVKFFTKSDTPKESKLCDAEQLSSTDIDSEPGVDLMEYEVSSTKVDFAGMKSEVCAEVKVTKSKDDDQFEMRRHSNSSLPLAVSPCASMKSSAEEATELEGLLGSLDYLDDWEDGPTAVEEDSFALSLADDIFDIKLDEDGSTIPRVVDIAGYDSFVPSEQQIERHALTNLRLQVQPNKGALDEITALLQSPPDSYTVESKSTFMRQRIIMLATEASDVCWWRENKKLFPEILRKAHLEHLVALTFAVLQADEWKRTSEEKVPLQTHFNAQDDIRHICQLLSGIWNRVNHFLARDSYALFGAGVDQLERSHAVKKMVRMFDVILCQTE